MAQAKQKLQQIKQKDTWTVEEYLEFEKTSPIRHELVNGHLFAMAGETKNHNRIAVDLSGIFNAQLFAAGCEAFAENVKVRIHESLFYYPDVAVTCEAASEDEEDEYLIVSPVLIVEVLSKTSVRTDRVEKKDAYQKLASLREYAIVSQESVRIEVYRHEQADAAWQCEVLDDLESEVMFQSIGLAVKLSDIYRRVRLVAENEEEEEEN